MAISPFTCEKLKELLHYDPATGVFTWQITRGSRAPVGKVAGCRGSRCWQIVIDHKHYKGHHLAWLYVYGEWPKVGIDHVNGNHFDNRIGNLRLATQQQNLRNRGAQKNNKSGFKGVCWHRDASKWRATIKVSGKQISLGVFRDPKEAHAAYAAAAQKLHGEFARVE